MPIGTYTMLKGAEPSFGEDDMTSAFYYAYGPGNTAVSKYGKISGVITLPESPTGRYWKREKCIHFSGHYSEER